MIYYYGSEISPNKIETVEGFLVCRNVPIARIGSQDYQAWELQLDGDPYRVIKVKRYEEDVFEPAVMASFEGKPVTDRHPPENVTPENFSHYAKGHAQNVRREGEYIMADLYINDSNLISDILNGVKREVSCGYMCDYLEDGEDYKQTHIRGNHVAVVSKGRAGKNVAIQDSAEAGKGRIMSKMLKEVLKAFGASVRDANPEEIEKLAEVTADALESEAQEGEPVTDTQEPEPAQDAEAVDPVEEVTEEVTKEVVLDDDPNAGLAEKLDKLIELLSTARVFDQEVVKLDKVIDELETQAASQTISADEMGDCDAPVKDSAVQFLKSMRPVVAGISNKKERARVTDALIKAVSKQGMGALLNAQKSGAIAARDASSQTRYEKICADQAAAYNSRNPHKKED